MPGGETGWILETNEPMNRAMEGMGGEVVKKLPALRAGALGPARLSRLGARMGAVSREELLEAQAIEERRSTARRPRMRGRPLPARARATEIDAVAARCGPRRSPPRAGSSPASRPWRSAERPRAGPAPGARVEGDAAPQAAADVVASRSFLIDVHVLGAKQQRVRRAEARRGRPPRSRSRCARRGRTGCRAAAAVTA